MDRQIDEKQAAQVALKFMDRVTLNGAEVPTFLAIRNWLAEMAEEVPGAQVTDQPDEEVSPRLGLGAV